MVLNALQVLVVRVVNCVRNGVAGLVSKQMAVEGISGFLSFPRHPHAIYPTDRESMKRDRSERVGRLASGWGLGTWLTSSISPTLESQACLLAARA